MVSLWLRMSTAVEPQPSPPKLRSPQADSPPKQQNKVEAALSALHTPAHERTEAQIAALVTWCRVNNLGSALGGSVNLDLLCRAMKAEEYEEDHVLFRQGDAGSVYYIVFSGEISLYVNTTLSALNTILKPAAQTAVLGSRLMRGLRTSQSGAAKAGGARGCAVSATAAPTSERPPAAAAAAPPAAGTGRRGSCRSAIAAAALGSSASLLLGRSSSPHAAAPAAAPAEKGQAQPGPPSEASGSTSKPASPPPRRRTSLSGAAIVGLPVEAPISKEEAARLEAAKMGKCVHTATAGTGFGDLALISSQPRAAGAVVRNGPCMLLAIRREAYDSIVKAEAAKALRQKVALMRNGLTLTPCPYPYLYPYPYPYP